MIIRLSNGVEMSWSWATVGGEWRVIGTILVDGRPLLILADPLLSPQPSMP